VVLTREQQHAADEIGRRDANGARHGAEHAGRLGRSVRVRAVRTDAHVVAVHDVVDVVLLAQLDVGVVGRRFDHFVDPFHGTHGRVSLGFVHDGRTFVESHVGVRVHADDEHVAQQLLLGGTDSHGPSA
jgi:hypothetical protein